MSTGHKTATFYVNIGINAPGEVAPPNMSHPVVAPFQITGPTNTEYPNASFCLPQVPLVSNLTFNIGDNVTIQVIELAQHGAAIYNVGNLIRSPSIEIDKMATVCRCNASRPSGCTRSQCIQLLQLVRLEFPTDLCNRQPQQRCFTNGNRIIEDVPYAASASCNIRFCVVVGGKQSISEGNPYCLLSWTSIGMISTLWFTSVMLAHFQTLEHNGVYVLLLDYISEQSFLYLVQSISNHMNIQTQLGWKRHCHVVKNSTVVYVGM
jgi:hypothetical protein